VQLRLGLLLTGNNNARTSTKFNTFISMTMGQEADDTLALLPTLLAGVVIICGDMRFPQID
jgi:hypothetical protein